MTIVATLVGTPVGILAGKTGNYWPGRAPC
jgi:hypothetical protein